MTSGVLTTQRLLLRPHSLADFEESAALWAEPEVVKFISGTPSTREESWTRLLRYIGHWQALGFGYWVVCDRHDNSFLGEVGFADFHRQVTPALPDVPEAGWVLAPRVHGRGIATEAVARILQWADTEAGWPRTLALFSPDHAASQHVAHKLGYRAADEVHYKGQLTRVMMRENFLET